jgi:hypothetical protein
MVTRAGLFSHGGISPEILLALNRMVLASTSALRFISIAPHATTRTYRETTTGSQFHGVASV